MDIDYLWMARVVVRRHLQPGLLEHEDAVQEAALAGWLADQRWQPDRGTHREAYVYHAMHLAVIDQIRHHYGRAGYGPGMRNPAALGERTPLSDLIPEQSRPLEQSEAHIDLARARAQAVLYRRELEWVEAFLDDIPPKVLRRRWGVSQSRVSQIKASALKKLRAVA